jgi:hypothetical protein
MKTIRFITQLCSALSLLTILSLNSFAGGAPTNVGVSDQKAGSVLVFPYFTTKGTADTRITISNTGMTKTIVHLFFIDESCNQADIPVCLTANASTSFLASDMDPSNAGYIIAVTVDAFGCPTNHNGLIGNAFVNDGTTSGNYGAEAFWAYGSAAEMATCNLANMTATLNFNVLSCPVMGMGAAGLDALPTQFVAEIQSPVTSVGQRIVVAGLAGDINVGQESLSAGSAMVGMGLLYNQNEIGASFSTPFSGTCLKIATITTSSPRILGGLAGGTRSIVKAGESATMKWSVGGAVGLILTPKGANTWSGIRALHKTNVAANTLTIPIYAPTCAAGFATAP